MIDLEGLVTDPASAAACRTALAMMSAALDSDRPATIAAWEAASSPADTLRSLAAWGRALIRSRAMLAEAACSEAGHHHHHHGEMVVDMTAEMEPMELTAQAAQDMTVVLGDRSGTAAAVLGQGRDPRRARRAALALALLGAQLTRGYAAAAGMHPGNLLSRLSAALPRGFG